MQLAHAGLQNQTLSFATIMKIFNNNNSIASIQRLIEKDEQAIIERSQQAQQAEIENQQAITKAQIEDRQAERDLKDHLILEITKLS